jgi:hypothetical protein
MIGLALNLYYWSLRDKPLQSIYVFDLFLLLRQAARRVAGLAASMIVDKICLYAMLHSTPL